jgi:rod shape-determining protein MreC
MRRSLLVPFLALQRQAELIKTSRGRFAAVVAERDSAAVGMMESQALAEENERLRSLLGLRGRLTTRHVPAEVLHQSRPGDGLTVLLSAGSTAGIAPMSPVVAPSGLLGIVRSVDPGSSVAVVWSHPEFRASAMTLDGSVFGIIAPREPAGPGTQLLELRGVPYRRVVEIGTWIYTSGRGIGGGVYPRGIPIGRVIAAADEEEGWARTYLIHPAVHPASVTHVIVLLPGATDLTVAFDTLQS